MADATLHEKCTAIGILYKANSLWHSLAGISGTSRKGERVAVSKRLRYEVFRRDNFACRYCGASAPEVKLTTDHVIPQALGGRDDPANLVTACMPCNSGKSSTSPDAPVVAEVAQEALRWAYAIKQAQAEMLADSGARSADCEQFREWWDAWGRQDGDDFQRMPKDPNWEFTVSQLTSAGLPLAILKDCIAVAMSQRGVLDENKFRYMCGCAWKKVSELQDRASALAKPEEPESADEVESESSSTDAAVIDNWSAIILGQRDPADVAAAADESLSRTGDASPSSALWFLIEAIDRDRAALRDTLAVASCGGAA